MATAYLGDAVVEAAFDKASSEGYRKWSPLWWGSVWDTVHAAGLN
jgi:hypothetical protein